MNTFNMFDISIFKEYYFIQDKDSSGNDIDYIDSIDINYLKKIADNNDNCIGFNTWGYIKNKINEPNDFINLYNRYNLKYNGLFIKKSKYNLDEKLSINKLTNGTNVTNGTNGTNENKLINGSKLTNGSKLLPIICINLERREDRKNNMIKMFEKRNIKNYEFFKAVDCKELKPSAYIKKLFEGNRNNYNKAIIACCLSHINVWKKLLDDPNNDAYIILEDDVDIVDNFDYFNMQLSNMQSHDIIYLGYFKVNKKIKKVSLFDLEIKIEPLNRIEYCIGGQFGYLITKKAAKILVDSNNIIYPIDWEILSNKKLELYQTNFELVRSDYVTNMNNVDSDIQYNKDVLNFDEIDMQVSSTEEENNLNSICNDLINEDDDLYLIINESTDVKFSYLDETIIPKIETIIINKIKEVNSIDIVYIGYYIDPIELYGNYEKYNVFDNNSVTFKKIDKLEDDKTYAYYLTKNGAKKILNKSDDLCYYLLTPRLIY